MFGAEHLINTPANTAPNAKLPVCVFIHGGGYRDDKRKREEEVEDAIAEINNHGLSSPCRMQELPYDNNHQKKLCIHGICDKKKKRVTFTLPDTMIYQYGSWYTNPYTNPLPVVILLLREST